MSAAMMEAPPGAAQEAPCLPTLRQELEILKGQTSDDGTPRWLLFDPVRNAFHTLNAMAVTILSAWAPVPPSECLGMIHANNPDADISGEDIEAMTEFLYQQKLTQEPPGNDPAILANQEASARLPFHEMLVHRYLFFRIPVFRPQNFLDAVAPSLQFLFRPLTAWLIALLGIIGIYFTGQQWDQFVTTFWHFFTLEGLLFYGISLIIIKSLHELGHAFAAHHFGTRVPVIGVAFLVMFPVLYTDTTDAWRLTDKRHRLWIDSGGMIVELSIACLSIFLWSFLPDGPARSAAFFAATTSWAFSLLVNLNPCMRFDGYYILSDFFNIQNMQKQGFDMGRWVMRETLFGLKKDKPFAAPRRRMIGLCAYAYSTWVYRFFLFIGIAILVHHLFPKAIGIVLFVIEILIFIALPCWREIKTWWSHRMTIISTRRGRVTLSLTALSVFALAYPWQSSVRAPAMMRPTLQTEIYPVHAAKIEVVYAREGDVVTKGDVLFKLSSPSLTYDRDQTLRQISLLNAQINRSAATMEDRRLGILFQDDLSKEQSSLEGLNTLIDELVVRAPHDGIISDIAPNLHKDLYVGHTHRLGRVIDPSAVELIALPEEDIAARLETGGAVTFIPDDANLPRVKATVSQLAPTSESAITDKALTSLYGGSLATREAPDGSLVANRPVFKIHASIDAVHTTRAHRGVAHIKAKATSPLLSLYRSVSRVLIRETDF